MSAEVTGPPQFNLARDVMSGTIMAATSVPQLIAYAETVGYAGYRGLATAGPPLAAWGVATGHPFMNSGVTSVTALMAKADLSGDTYLASFGEEAYVELVAAYSLYVGIASAALAAAGLGELAQKVPAAVAAGFKWGCSTVVLLSAIPNGLFAGGSKQLKELVSSDRVFGPVVTPELKSAFPGTITVLNTLYTATHPWKWAAAPTVLFLVGTAFVMQGKAYLPSAAPPGTEVILLTAAATLYSVLADYGGGVVGAIPAMKDDAGISLLGGKIRLPIEVFSIKKLLTDVPIVERCFGGSRIMLAISATTFAAVNFLSIAAIAGIFLSEDGIVWNPARELLAQGVSCGVAAAVGSAPVSGSLSRSLVSRMAGTTSQAACIVTAACWILLQPYLSVLSPTPKAALSAIIVAAVVKGIVFPKAMLQLTGTDAVVGWGTGVAILASTPTQGFIVGLLLYLLLDKLWPAIQTRIAGTTVQDETKSKAA